VLIAAHRRELPRHDLARTAVKTLAEGLAPWGIPVFCLAEFVRVATHPRVLDPPTPIDRALEFLEKLLGGPTVRLLLPGPRYPEIFDRCVREAEARGNLAFDAQIAAVCMEHGARDLWTFDRDFSRFSELRPDPSLGDSAGSTPRRRA
jgi:toxin-antitoxin system PIN domain toxin